MSKETRYVIYYTRGKINQKVVVRKDQKGLEKYLYSMKMRKCTNIDIEVLNEENQLELFT